jgi:HK97 family phage prohead protease
METGDEEFESPHLHHKARSLTWPFAYRDDHGESGRAHGGRDWGVEARVLDRGRLVVEVFERGAYADVDPGRVPLTARHPRDNQELPIGVTVELRDEADALHGAWHVSKTALGDEVLELARDGVPLGLSVGFMEVAGGSRWSPDRRRVTRTRAALDHVAVVRVGRAYAGAGVQGVRAAHGPALAYPLATLARLRHG